VGAWIVFQQLWDIRDCHIFRYIIPKVRFSQVARCPYAWNRWHLTVVVCQQLYSAGRHNTSTKTKQCVVPVMCILITLHALYHTGPLADVWRQNFSTEIWLSFVPYASACLCIYYIIPHPLLIYNSSRLCGVVVIYIRWYRVCLCFIVCVAWARMESTTEGGSQNPGPCACTWQSQACATKYQHLATPRDEK